MNSAEALLGIERQPPVCLITGFSEALMDTVVRAARTQYKDEDIYCNATC